MTFSTTRRAMTRTAAVLAASALVAAVAGCSTPGAASTGSSKKTLTIGVAETSTSISFLATLDNAIEKEAARLGMKTIILNANLDNATEANNITTLAARHVDAILVISSSPTAVVPAINRATAQGIPVFAVNAALDKAAKVITYVGASDFDYGVAEGDLLVKALPHGGKTAIILGPLGDTPEVKRLEGIKSVLRKHPAIEIVATPTDGFDNSKNLAATQDLLSKYRTGSLDAIVAEGPQMYVGADYAHAHGRGEIKFIAGDYSKQVEASIRSGALYGTVNQSPDLEGQLAAQYAHSWLTGGKNDVPRPEHLIDLPPVTKDNVDQHHSTWSS
ncbi:sugar ABC transporter substrate-binding protein [Curtobacterium sp. ISL-83]|uniref:sugar ABC transporter substrate-binding protein n=1 Tax=Curtobacterium sp. ISL-83 TaxID=2819145 RepID=UPI001BE678F3|nr:sugar ABC transporter substrate-binding protein [Curtobacterium sp. ISL-83]MBT2502266.1 sugar ABC transporter substrate-binding protein [Curtobacterium sp. ISL-83]